MSENDAFALHPEDRHARAGEDEGDRPAHHRRRAAPRRRRLGVSSAATKSWAASAGPSAMVPSSSCERERAVGRLRLHLGVDAGHEAVLAQVDRATRRRLSTCSVTRSRRTWSPGADSARACRSWRGTPAPGMGLPCGQVGGVARAARPAAPRPRRRSRAPTGTASRWALCQSRPMTSVSRRSASRCLRTTLSARSRPFVVRRDGAALRRRRSRRPRRRRTISDTDGAAWPRRSASRAWMTGVPSSSSSWMASRYSSTGGWKPSACSCYCRHCELRRDGEGSLHALGSGGPRRRRCSGRCRGRRT